MEFRQVKFWLVLSVLFCAACGENSISSTANNRSNAANTNSAVNNSAVNTSNAAVNTSNAAANVAAKRELDVPYVPTHEMVVDAMLQMAGVRASDVLYDLGSGDGRIPITAAQRFGTRGVGIDLNPERIKEANENAQRANVTNRIKFIEGDLFEQDFSEATVLTLYLLPEVNLKLRPKILQMKPGTRVVSHNYDMGDWKPEETKTITTPNGEEHYVYFWRVPERK